MSEDEVSQDTLDDIAKPPPAQLYKYFSLSGDSLEHVRQLLVDSKLFFPNASSFNDPLDCKLPISYRKRPLKEAVQHWIRVSLMHEPDIDAETRAKQSLEIAEYARSDAGHESMVGSVHKSLDEHGIACFAESPSQTLLWSYYANGHRGIAVRFNLTEDALDRLGVTYLPLKVRYRKKLPTLDYYDLHNKQVQLVFDMFGIKAYDWRHEGEWRVVLFKSIGAHLIPPEMIDGVIFGVNTKEEDKQLVREWVVARDMPTELLQAVFKPGSIKLELVPCPLAA